MKKRNFIASIFIVSLFFVSCSSVKMPVPGESKIKTNTLYYHYYTIGKGYEDIKNYSKALEFYSYIANVPEYKNAVVFRMANCAVQSKDWEAAAVCYEKILKSDPENSTIKNSLAYIYAQKGDIKKALEISASLCQEQNVAEESYVNYISLLISENRVDEATNSFNLLKELYPNCSSLSEIEKQLKKISRNESEDASLQADSKTAKEN